ncbi:metal-dependent hydrolase, partial [Candidatus Heimdallarchaeota archaeon]
MTLVTTHIALEGLLIWAGMGSKYRKFFRKHLGLFSLLTLTAAIPDLDTFIYLHRTYLHSLFWPVLLIMGALILRIYLQYIKKIEPSERQLLISRSLYLVGAFMILHSILDLNPGPVMLFYPFDNRLYSFNVGIVWDLDSWYLLHDLNIKWTSVSFNEGINSYFVNLTPAERIAYFGSEFVETFVSEFPIHLLTVLAWLVFFPGRVLYRYLEKTKINNFFQKLSQYKRPVFALSLVL